MKKFFCSKWILALIPSAIILAAALAGGLEVQPFPDSGDYLVLAENFFHGFEQGTAVEPGWRTPGYPAILWAGMIVWRNAGYLLVNMILLYIIVLFMLYRADEWRLSRVWLVIMMGCSGGIIALGASALSEITFIFFLLLNLEFIRRKMPVFAGLMLAVAVAVRPAALFLWIIELAWMAGCRCPWRKCLIFVVAANSIALIWAVRNYSLFEHFAYTSHSGRYAYYYKVGSAISRNENRPFEEVRMELAAPLEKQYSNPFARDKAAGRLAAEWIWNNPAVYLKSQLMDLPNFWMPDITPFFERVGMTDGNNGTLDVLRRDGIGAAIKHYFENTSFAVKAITVGYSVLYIAILGMIVIGMAKMIFKGRVKALIALILILGYFWLLPAGNLDWRFRMVIWPVLVFVALYGLPERHSKRVATGVTTPGNQA